MSGNMALGLVMAVAALALVGVALGRRRLPSGQIVKLALIWLGIILVATMAAAIGLRI